MAHANVSTITPLKIQRDDWKRLPAWYKSHIDGIPRVLSHANGIAEYRPVQILH